MDPTLIDWLNLSLRWMHLIAGISWIGASFYFVWLDSHLEPPHHSVAGKSMVEGELWMVHSGGFYQVERRKIGPGEMPEKLHWFKWEATFTWITGFLLLSLAYYMTRGVYLVDSSVASITPAQATIAGLTTLAVCWLVYDFIFQSRFAASGKFATWLSLALLIALDYGLCHVFSGRGAYIHFGASLATIMVLNVWVRILPAQQQMIDATKEGRQPDFSLAANAKRRSMHNSYMTLPVLFMMISNHYPITYGSHLNWVVLILLVILGASVRHCMIAPAKEALWTLVAAFATCLALFVLTRPQAPLSNTYQPSSGPVTALQAQAIIQSRCVRCHSSSPTDETFQVAPQGVMFDTPELIESYADRIKIMAVDSKTMPLANKTGMTADERSMLGKWLDTVAATEE